MKGANMNNFKTKINKKKLELTIVFLAFALVALLKIVSAASSPVLAEDAPGMPSLFYNDNHFVYSVPGSATYLPLQYANGVHYIPLDMLKLLNNIKMDSNDNYTDKFYIQYKNNFISFHISAEKASNQNAEYSNCKVYKYMGITYVPVAVIAKELGLDWEYRPEYEAGRIKEAGAIMTFDELLERFIPKTRPVSVPTPEPAPPETNSPLPPYPPLVLIEPTAEYTVPPPPVSESPRPTTKNADHIPPETTSGQTPEPETQTQTDPATEPTTAEDTREIQNYLMFCGADSQSGAAKIDEILAELEKNGKMKAVFFLSRDEIAENPEILSSIYASGHGIGIKFDPKETGGEPDDIVAELEEANALIYSVLKHKAKLCIYSDPKEAKTPKYFDKDNLAANGYYLCGHTADILDLADIKNPGEMMDFIKRKKYNVFMFDINGDCKKYLEWLHGAANSKFYIKLSYINNANIENLKLRTNR